MKRDTDDLNFLYWYDYGFSGAIEQAAKMERSEAVGFLARETATFANCDPNFAATERASDPTFIFNFTMYLCGRLDERRDASSQTKN